MSFKTMSGRTVPWGKAGGVGDQQGWLVNSALYFVPWFLSRPVLSRPCLSIPLVRLVTAVALGDLLTKSWAEVPLEWRHVKLWAMGPFNGQNTGVKQPRPWWILRWVTIWDSHFFQLTEILGQHNWNLEKPLFNLLDHTNWTSLA